MKKLASIFSVISIVGLCSGFSLNVEKSIEDSYVVDEACPCQNKKKKRGKPVNPVPPPPPTQSFAS